MTRKGAVARGFVYAGVAAGLLGGCQVLFLRLHQAWGDLPSSFYVFFMSVHGSWMELFLGPALLFALPGSVLVPPAAEREELRFPRLHRISLVLFVAAGGLLLASAGCAYVSSKLPEAPALPVAFPLWLGAVCLEHLAAVLLAGNFLATLGARSFCAAVPFGVSALAASSVLLAITDSVLLVRGVGFLLTGGLAAEDPRKMHAVLVFFTQPYLCALLLPALGIAADILERQPGLRFPGRRFAPFVFFGTMALVLAIWFANQRSAGFLPVPEYLHSTSELATRVFILPLLFFGAGAIARLPRIRVRDPAGLFATGCFAGLLVGGIPGLLLSFVGAAGYLHGTEFAVAHVHFMLGPIAIFAGLAAQYFLFSSPPERKLGESLGRLHFWGTFLCFQAVFLPLFALGIRSGESRAAVRLGGDPAWLGLRCFVTASLAFLLLAQLPLLVSLYRAWREPHAPSSRSESAKSR